MNQQLGPDRFTEIAYTVLIDLLAKKDLVPIEKLKENPAAPSNFPGINNGELQIFFMKILPDILIAKLGCTSVEIKWSAKVG